MSARGRSGSSLRAGSAFYRASSNAWLAVPSRWLSAAGCAAPHERLGSCATRTGGCFLWESGHSCLRRCCQKQPGLGFYGYLQS